MRRRFAARLIVIVGRHKIVGKYRNAINTLLGITLLSGVTYCTHNHITGESRVRELCDEIQAGNTVTELKKFASEHGLSSHIKDSGISFTVETKTFGRYGCKITAESGIVKKAEYYFAD